VDPDAIEALLVQGRTQTVDLSRSSDLTPRSAAIVK
jgi:hypothetical protein